MAAKMTVKRIYWSRKPGQFLDINTGAEIVNTLPYNGSIRDWYNTLIDVIFENTTSNQNIMVFSRDIQTILEHLYSYRAFLKDTDTLPNHGAWPVTPDTMNLFGFLSNEQCEKEGWVNSGLPRELSDHTIRIFDLNQPLSSVEIVIKGFPDFF